MMRYLTASLAILVCCGSYVQADLIGVDFTNAGPVATVSEHSAGFEFSPTAPMSVTRLGAFDYLLNGFGQPQQVGLWTASGVLLASTFVDNTDPLEGVWRFRSLVTPVALTPGQAYVVASQGGEGYTFNPIGFVTHPSLNYVQARSVFVGSTANSPLSFPTVPNTSQTGFFGGNLGIASATSVPEPSTFTLCCAMSIVAMLVRARMMPRASHPTC
jgi:hypothetical protein